MSTSKPQPEVKAAKVEVTATHLLVALADGRVVKTPIHLYPTLERAQPLARQALHLIGDGQHLHWPELDLSLTVDQVVAGRPERSAAAPKPSAEGFEMPLSAKGMQAFPGKSNPVSKNDDISAARRIAQTGHGAHPTNQGHGQISPLLPLPGYGTRSKKRKT